MIVNSLTKLNGANYEEWAEAKETFLAISNIDIAFTKYEPLKPID